MYILDSQGYKVSDVQADEFLLGTCVRRRFPTLQSILYHVSTYGKSTEEAELCVEELY